MTVEQYWMGKDLNLDALWRDFDNGAGYIQKISQKGWICKTWEGELAMANLPGAMPEIFRFTVRDPEVAHQIEQNAGNRVSLTYEQHRGVPTACFGETEYFIVKLNPVADATPAPVKN